MTVAPKVPIGSSLEAVERPLEGVPTGLGRTAVRALQLRYPQLSLQRAAEELWDFCLLAVADRSGPTLRYPCECWFDAGLAALQTITAGWETVDGSTARLIQAAEWYLAYSGPLDQRGQPDAIPLSSVDQVLTTTGDCSDSILLPVRLKHQEGDHIIGLHMCAEGEQVHVVFLDSAPRHGDAFGLEQSCAMHVRLDKQKVLEWLQSPIGEQILTFQGMLASTLEEWVEEMQPWLGPVDWSPVIWAFHVSQVQSSCVPSMTQLAWSLEYAHPRMDLVSRTQGHVQAGWTAARWQRGLCEMALDLAETIHRPDAELRPYLDAFSTLLWDRESELNHLQDPGIEVPHQITAEVFAALSSVSMVTSEEIEALCTAEAKVCRHAQRCLRLLAAHLSRLQRTHETASSQALWLLYRWSRGVVTNPNGQLEPLSDLAMPDRRSLNLLGIMQRVMPATLAGYQPAVRSWARRLLERAQQIPASYPDLEETKRAKEPRR